jgi:hypothetical protein
MAQKCMMQVNEIQILSFIYENEKKNIKGKLADSKLQKQVI